MSLIGLLIILIVMCVILYFLKMYVVSMLPHPAGVLVLCVVALIFILILLSKIGALGPLTMQF